MAASNYFDNVNPIKMFKMQDWDVDIDNIKIDEETGREVCTVIIGEEKDRLNVITQVTDDFYKDILMDIVEDPKHYRAETSRGTIPRLFITHGGRIVDHNIQMFYMKKSCHTILNDIPSARLCDALREAVNAEGSLDNPDNLHYISDKITEVTGMRLETKFVKALVIEHVMSDYLEEDFSVLLNRLDTMSYKEFHIILNDVNYHEWTGRYKRDATKDIVETEKCSPDELKDAVMQDLYLRALFGRLKER